MGGSGGGKTSTQTSSSPFAPMLAQFAKSALPVQKTMAGQELEALQTGGITNRIPIINRAVSAARGAASQSTEQIRQMLARAGLSNSSFAQAMLGEERMTSNEAIAQIPTNIAGEFIRGAPQTVSSGIQAGSVAANVDRTQTYTPSFWELFNQGLQAVSQGAGAAAGAAMA